MKYKRLNGEIKAPYAENLMKSRGIENLEEFISPSSDALQSWRDLDNILDGVELIKETIKLTLPKILIVVDCDNDGYCAAAIIFKYLSNLMGNNSKNMEFAIHEGKQHGLEDLASFLDKGYDLVILPDAGTNDGKYFKEHLDTKFLILDHHELEGEEVKYENAIIINNQISKNYKNKSLCGAGVTYQFCRALDASFKEEDYKGKYCNADYFLDLVAWATIGDMMNVLELENRWIITRGLKYPFNNYFFNCLVEKQEYSITKISSPSEEEIQEKLGPISIAFYITPLINAMVRVGTMAEKERMFIAFIDGKRLVPCNKRGAKGTMEEVAIESARECTNARSRQNRIQERATEAINIRMKKSGAIDSKILLVELEDEDDFPPELNGLVAMQLSAAYKKPTIVGRVNKEGYLKGSARGLNNSDLSDLKSFFSSSNLFNLLAGHANAHGFSIHTSNIDKLHSYAAEELKDINFEEDFYEVSFIFNSNDKNIGKVVEELASLDITWGQGNPTPLIAVEKIRFSKDDIQSLGRNLDTLKLYKDGVAYMKFFAKETIQKLKELPSEEFYLTVVGKPNLNYYAGRTTPQIFIEDMNIENVEVDFGF